MELSDILSEASVVVLSDKFSKEQVLHSLADRAAQVIGADAGEVFSAVNEREKLGSTGLGNGIAIPHGRFPGLPAVTAVFARLAEPVDFEAVDDQPVDLVMLLLAPIGAGADHLKALARVARVLRTESVIDDLRRTTDPARLYEILTLPLTASRAA